MKKRIEKIFKRVIALAICIILSNITVLAIDGVYHEPYGIDALYSVEKTERFPRDPIAGDNVYIKITTWPIEWNQSTWVEWTKNGQQQASISGQWKYNTGNNSYWEVPLGDFNKGDVIEYTVHANHNGTNEKVVGPYKFTVTDWEYLNKINSYVDYNNRILLKGSSSTGTFFPEINISFFSDEIFRVQMSPKGNINYETGLSSYTVSDVGSQIVISNNKLDIKINKNPYKMEVYRKSDNKLLTKEYKDSSYNNISWLTDGNNIINKVEDRFYTPSDEAFFGFGEHYNNFNKRGHNIDNYVYNQYKNQNEKTYMSIPFFINSNGYGLFANSTFYSKFKIATEKNDMYSFTVNTGGSDKSSLDYYFIFGDDLENVVENYSDITGKATLPPKEAFGLWMSANEWDRESDVKNAINQCSNNDIPASMIVLEQWSDEKTFYIFNDATYTPVSGDQALSGNDFTFNGKWSNPKKLADDIHDAGMKLLLWQVPLLKYTGSPYIQNDNDRTYMENSSYAVKDGKGGFYKIPDGKWFSGSYLLDFTNPLAVNWWMSKRNYLFDYIGIDGFKTDGGEMLWGRNNILFDGTKGNEMRNLYPNKYISGYYDFVRTKVDNPITFSRSGTFGVQKDGMFWSGDQESTFYAFDQAVVAGLSANISGVPFIGWDMAGFTGDFPSSKLYKRSAAQQAFSPLMQFHSEKANPPVSEERSPWNVAIRNNDSTVIPTFTKYANMRYNLIPYIYSQAKKSTVSGTPLMRAMVLESPDDINTYNIKDQYMLGEYLLVAPILDDSNTKNVYLPEGVWYDIVYGGIKSGNQTTSYYANEDMLPVFAKAGAIIPMNLNPNYEFGGTIGNDLYTYSNLTFRVYPYGNSSFLWYDDIGSNSDKLFECSENYDVNKVEMKVPSTTVPVTLEVFSSKPKLLVMEILY